MPTPFVLHSLAFCSLKLLSASSRFISNVMTEVAAECVVVATSRVQTPKLAWIGVCGQSMQRLDWCVVKVCSMQYWCVWSKYATRALADVLT